MQDPAGSLASPDGELALVACKASLPLLRPPALRVQADSAPPGPELCARVGPSGAASEQWGGDAPGTASHASYATRAPFRVPWQSALHDLAPTSCFGFSGHPPSVGCVPHPTHPTGGLFWPPFPLLPRLLPIPYKSSGSFQISHVQMPFPSPHQPLTPLTLLHSQDPPSTHQFTKPRICRGWLRVSTMRAVA